VNVKQFLEATGMNCHQLSQKSGVAYSTLSKHLNHGHELSRATARKLVAVVHDSGIRMTEAAIMGLDSAAEARTGTTG
jgi:DNA-binding LacI/PurR family transcriptional regulator